MATKGSSSKALSALGTRRKGKILSRNQLLSHSMIKKLRNIRLNPTKGGDSPMLKSPMFDMESGMSYVKGTLALEGFRLENKEELLIKAKVSGRISEEEFIKKALELANE